MLLSYVSSQVLNTKASTRINTLARQLTMTIDPATKVITIAVPLDGSVAVGGVSTTVEVTRSLNI